MNQFELFCMVFYVLDADWDETHDAVVGEYLSGANPFLFADIGSASPDIFKHFCTVINDKITVDNSYALAEKYIDDLNNPCITKAFHSISPEGWHECVLDYLSRDHKGK